MVDFVYLMSASHSGSTLLALLLASHPEVATVGETSAIQLRGSGDTGLCSCGAALEGCPFWKKLEEKLVARDGKLNLPALATEFRLRDRWWTDRLLQMEYQGRFLETVRDALLAMSPSWRIHSPRLFDHNRIFIEEATRLLNGRVFVDSSKEPHRLKFLLRIRSLDTKVIHLVRDGRGVMASYMRRDNWTAERSADEWRRSIVSEERLLDRLMPGTFIQLRYEDLCSEVEPNVRRLLVFMGLDPQEWNPDFQSRGHHILGNRMRMNRSSEVRLDERWRRMLTDEHLAIFDEVAGHLNRKYGYT